MKKSTKALIGILVCVIVLAGAVVLLKVTEGVRGGEDASSQTSSQTTDLIGKEEEDIASILVTNEHGSYTIKPQEKEMEETSYYIEELHGFVVNTTSVTSAVTNGYKLTCQRDLGAVEDLSEYGLDAPAATVKVTYKDGDILTYALGDATPSNSSYYYALVGDSDHVYIVSSVSSNFFNPVSNYVDKSVVSLTPETEDGTNVFTKLTLSGGNYPEVLSVAIDSEAGTCRLTAPVAFDADKSVVNTITAALESITASSVAVLHPDESKLQELGLDAPEAVIEFTANGQDYKLSVAKKDDSTYYMLRNGVDLVYEVGADTVSTWISLSRFEMRDHTVLSGIVTEFSGVTYAGAAEGSISISRTVDEEESTEENTVYAYEATLSNGNTLSYDTFRTDFADLLMLEVTEEAQDAPAGDPALRLELSRFDADGLTVVEFYPASERRYYAVRDGEVLGLVRADVYEELEVQLVALLDGDAE